MNLLQEPKALPSSVTLFTGHYFGSAGILRINLTSGINAKTVHATFRGYRVTSNLA